MKRHYTSEISLGDDGTAVRLSCVCGWSHTSAIVNDGREPYTTLAAYHENRANAYHAYIIHLITVQGEIGMRQSN